MPLLDKLTRVNELQGTIHRQGKLPVEVLKRINFKFRLEWNYHSNSMEGNSLTRQETRTVMVGNITVEGKAIRDVFEMSQHDELISMIIKMGKGELHVSEKRIKEIHAAIMHEEDEVKKKQVGEWKNEPNYLYNYKQERVDFVPPDETPERMHALINWLNAEKTKIEQGKEDALHPLVLASRFHLDYVTIHPFYDGNGRTARILTNIILIAFGYPPVWVKTEEKDQYGRYLTEAQGEDGGPELFYDFMAGLLIRSQGIVLDAAAGKEIEEPDDLDKKLAMLAKRLEMTDPQNEIVKHLNTEVFEEIYTDWLGMLIERSIVLVQKFNKFFKENQHTVSIVPANIYVPFAEERVGSILTRLSEQMVKDRSRLNAPELRVLFQTTYDSFIKGGLKTFNVNYGWEVKFNKTQYIITMDVFSGDENKFSKTVMEKLLHQPFSDAGIDGMVREFGETIYTHIIEVAKNIGIDLI